MFQACRKADILVESLVGLNHSALFERLENTQPQCTGYTTLDLDTPRKLDHLDTTVAELSPVNRWLTVAGRPVR